ncbi:hypothetical protein M5K25_009512 [Dendrobium thyrsiflorum]|uniref:DUF7811 domain-containing protein n=1 Tax=Dendrobium thyrsiflorum TaxID=117978 RepID=A0ABD0VCR2_DENTH
MTGDAATGDDATTTLQLVRPVAGIRVGSCQPGNPHGFYHPYSPSLFSLTRLYSLFPTADQANLSKPPAAPTLPPILSRRTCMGDPDVDHGFVFDDQGRTDILASPFFDVHFGNDETADDYVDGILYQLTLSLEEHIPLGRWYIVNNPSSSPNSTLSGDYYLACRVSSSGITKLVCNLLPLTLLQERDPYVDHGFVFDDQGRTDILASPFFNVHFGNDETADDYVDRILYQLTLSLEEHIPPGRWYIVNNPSSSPNSTTSPATTILHAVWSSSAFKNKQAEVSSQSLHLQHFQMQLASGLDRMTYIFPDVTEFRDFVMKKIKRRRRSKASQRSQRFQESYYMDPNQVLCLGALFDIAATNGLDMGRRLCIFGFCRSIEMLSDVVEDIVLEHGGEVFTAEKASKEGLQEKLSMTVAVPLLWGVPPASETLRFAVRSGGGIVEKVYWQWDFL